MLIGRTSAERSALGVAAVSLRLAAAQRHTVVRQCLAPAFYADWTGVPLSPPERGNERFSSVCSRSCCSGRSNGFATLTPRLGSCTLGSGCCIARGSKSKRDRREALGSDGRV